jgi:N-acetylglutamate synthase-like GNAT family acetyltransferase
MDNQKLIYRKLSINDIDLFIKLRIDFLTDFFKTADELENQKIIISLKSYFEKYITNENFIGIICEYNKEIISGAFLKIDEWPPNKNFMNGKVGTLLNVYTYPKYRKNGIGTIIVEKIIAEAKEQDVSIINLLATEDGEKVYKKLGFFETEDKSMRLKL